MASLRARSQGPAELGMDGGMDEDPIIKALERSTIHQTLKAARASLAEPTRPYTPMDRSLFQMASATGESRPSTALGQTWKPPNMGRTTSGNGGGGYPAADILDLSKPSGATGGYPTPGTPRTRWKAQCEDVIANLQALAVAPDSKEQSPAAYADLSNKLLELVNDIKVGKAFGQQEFAPRLLQAVLGLIGRKGAKCILRLSRCALVLLRIENATIGVQTSIVKAAYVNVAKVLFLYSKNEKLDAEFLEEGLIEQLLEVLQSDAPECASNDLRVYIVGALKNVSHDEAKANQKYLVQKGAINALFKLIPSEELRGNDDEVELFIQVTGALRNLASHHHSKFIEEEKLNTLTRLMRLNEREVKEKLKVELLTNVSRIFSKLTLHSGPCEVLCRSTDHVRQMARTLSSNADSQPLVLRLTFVLGNLTAKEDNLRLVYGSGCEGTSLTPQLLGKYWQKDRQLAKQEGEKSPDQVSAAKSIEDILVKLVRLIANMAINQEVGSTLASLSAVVDPLLEMLGSKKVADSEELVLNVVAAITNLLFYDVPSNLLFCEENKLLLCRLFRPLLLESYNIEALVECARALGNLSRHADARQAMASLRLDEILVILIDHDDRDLVFYVCGALVNLAADPLCTERLVQVCAISGKLVKLLRDAPLDDPFLQLVAIKVFTNLSLDPSMSWAPGDAEATREALEELSLSAAQVEEDEAAEAVAERQQMCQLAQHLLTRLPAAPAEEKPEEKAPLQFTCPVEGCGRRFDSQDKMLAHQERRHNSRAALIE